MKEPWARVIKKNIKGKPMLYLEFFDILQNKVRQKSLQEPYSQSAKIKAEKEIIPALMAEMNYQSIVPKKVSYTLEFFVKKYLIAKESLETYHEIEAKTDKVIKHFGKDCDIKTLTVLDCEDFLNELEVSNKTKKNYKHVLSGIFQTAQKAGYINTNPADLVDIGKIEQEKIEPFTKEQVSILIENAPNEMMKNYLAIAFYTGARTGEILGLMSKDIDFSNKTINFERQITKNKLKNSLKTSGSTRMIPMFDSAIPYLKAQLQYARDRKSLFLFCDERGKTFSGADDIRGDSKYGQWKKLLDKCKLTYRSMYHTRHTFITHALNSGNFKVMEVAQIVGHQSPQMIFKTYARFIKGEQLKIDRNIGLYDETTYTNTYTNKNDKIEIS